MPLYEYICEKCSAPSEILIRSQDQNGLRICGHVSRELSRLARDRAEQRLRADLVQRCDAVVWTARHQDDVGEQRARRDALRWRGDHVLFALRIAEAARKRISCALRYRQGPSIRVAVGRGPGRGTGRFLRTPDRGNRDGPGGHSQGRDVNQAGAVDGEHGRVNLLVRTVAASLYLERCERRLSLNSRRRSC